MHAVIECIPVVAGLVISLLYTFTKRGVFKNLFLIILPVISGIVANQLSAEGLDFLYVDILMAFVSTFSFILLSKYFARILHQRNMY